MDSFSPISVTSSVLCRCGHPRYMHSATHGVCRQTLHNGSCACKAFKQKLADRPMRAGRSRTSFILILWSALILIFAVAVILSVTRPAKASPAPPRQISVEAPRGRYVLYHRPTWFGEALFGPLWVFIPAEAEQLPSPPAPAIRYVPAPAPSQTPGNSGPVLNPAR